MSGLVLINKPVGLRSTRCVELARKKFPGMKVGHAGTLDSTASGLLILLVGSATRLSDYVMSLPKTYRVEIQLGAETDTCDFSGSIISSGGYENITENLFDEKLFSFSGWRMQIPPAISAVKLHGLPAHKLARSGHNVKISDKPVFFRSISRISNLHDGTVTLDITCSKGTYIRSFARDLGARLGCGAFVKSLKRTLIGNFSVENSILPAEEGYKLVSVSELVKNFHRVELTHQAGKNFLNGARVKFSSENIKILYPGTAGSDSTLCVIGDEFIGFSEYSKGYIRPLSIISLGQ